MKPTLVAVNKSLIGTQHMSLTLTVQVLNAFPNVKAGNIKWTNSTTDIPFTTSTDISSPAPFYQSYDDVKKVARLIVKNVSLDSGGGYKCTATNEAGYGSVVVSVAVGGKGFPYRFCNSKPYPVVFQVLQSLSRSQVIQKQLLVKWSNCTVQLLVYLLLISSGPKKGRPCLMVP